MPIRLVGGPCEGREYQRIDSDTIQVLVGKEPHERALSLDELAQLPPNLEDRDEEQRREFAASLVFARYQRDPDDPNVFRYVPTT